MESDRRMASRIPVLRLAVGFGNSECERDLLPAIVEAGDVNVPQRCLSADQLLECVRAGRIDAVLAAEGLHRLTAGTLVDLARARMPLVLLTSNPEEPRWQGPSGLRLPFDTDPGTVHQALLAAIRGER